MAYEIATAYVSIVPSLKGFESKMDDLFKGVVKQGDRAGTDSGDSFLGGFKGKALAGIAGVGLAVGAAFTDALAEAMDVKKTQAKLQASLGISADQAGNLGKTAGRLYSAGYGESIADLTEQVGSVQSAFQNLKLPDDQLEKLTGKALSFTQAFGGDVESVAQNVNTLLGSGLTKNADEAFDLLTKASQKVPAALRGDIADASDEYSQFFRTLGFSGNEAFDALVKGADKGTFGIDKTGDAIKEFTIRSTDMSKSSVDAFTSIGLDAKSMTDKILAGGDSAKGAFNQITDGILSIQDPAAQSQAALALFGTPLEDMNVQDIPEFLKGLKGMSGGMGDAAGAADAMDKAMGSTSSGIDLLWRNIKTNLVGFINDKVLPAVSAFTSWLAEKLTPVINEVVTWLGDHLGPVLQKVADFFVNVLLPAGMRAWSWFEENLLPTVQRIGEFIGSTFGNLFDILGGFIDFIAGVFTGDWSRAWDGIKAIFSGIWAQIQNIVTTAWDVLTGVGGKILDWLSGLPGWAWDRISAFGSFLVEKGAQFLQWIWDGITSKWEEVKAWFAAAPGNLWDFIQAGWQQVIQWGSNLISWIWQGTDGNGGIVGGAKAVFDWFLGLPGRIWDQVSGAFSAAASWGAEMMKYFVEGISGSDPYVRAAFAKTMLNAASSLGISVDALAGFFVGVEVNDTIDDYLNKLKVDAVLANPSRPFGNEYRGGGRAAGGIIPGIDPGRGIDNVLMPMRSGESVFVPEFTRAIGGEATVHAWNRAAEQGRLGEIFGPGLARGGVVGGLGRFMGGSFVKAMLKPILAALTEGVQNSTVASNGQWGPATDGSGLAANTQAARDFIVSKWGITNIGGVYGGSVPGSDHPIGKALDVMIANYLSQAGIAQGTSVADWFVANPNAFGTKYVIWRDRINQGGAWAPYQHPSGSNDTLQHRDHVHLSFLTGSGQFQGGSSVPADDQKSGFLGSLVGKIVSGFASKFGSATPNPVDGGAFPPNVERWRPLMADVLAKVGAYKGLNLSGYVDRGLMQINSESSGDPNAINNYDINAQRGDPSIGLLQVIGSTFRNALRGTPFESLIALGQRDPRASLTASTLYSLGRYTTLDRAWQGKPYDTGGWLTPGGQGINLLNKPEAVLTPAQSDAYVAHAKAIADGYGGRVMRVEFAGDGPLTEAMISTAKVTVDGVLVEAGNVLTRRRYQY